MSVLNECSKEDASVFEVIWSGYLDSNEYLKSYGGRALMDMKEAFMNGVMCGVGMMALIEKEKEGK